MKTGQQNISVWSHCLGCLSPPSLGLIFTSNDTMSGLLIGEYQCLRRAPPPVRTHMMAESSLEDKSTWLADIHGTSNDNQRWPWSPRRDREVQFKSMADSFSLPHKRKVDGQDNSVVENDCASMHMSVEESFVCEKTPWKRCLLV